MIRTAESNFWPSNRYAQWASIATSCTVNKKWLDPKTTHLKTTSSEITLVEHHAYGKKCSCSRKLNYVPSSFFKQNTNYNPQSFHIHSPSFLFLSSFPFLHGLFLANFLHGLDVLMYFFISKDYISDFSMKMKLQPVNWNKFIQMEIV